MRGVRRTPMVACGRRHCRAAWCRGMGRVVRRYWTSHQGVTTCRPGVVERRRTRAGLPGRSVPEGPLRVSRRGVTRPTTSCLGLRAARAAIPDQRGVVPVPGGPTRRLRSQLTKAVILAERRRPIRAGEPRGQRQAQRRSPVASRKGEGERADEAATDVRERRWFAVPLARLGAQSCSKVEYPWEARAPGHPGRRVPALASSSVRSPESPPAHRTSTTPAGASSISGHRSSHVHYRAVGWRKADCRGEDPEDRAGFSDWVISWAWHLAVDRSRLDPSGRPLKERCETRHADVEAVARSNSLPGGRSERGVARRIVENF